MNKSSIRLTKQDILGYAILRLASELDSTIARSKDPLDLIHRIEEILEREK